jgi:Domain of unknown function (DUF4126)
METIQAVSLTLGVAWAAGINLYAAILVLGYLGSTGSVDLPPDLAILTDPGVMLAAGFMYCVEFFADKVPGVDTGWDVLHTFIRIPAGALLAAGMAQGLNIGPAAELIALLIGGGLSATSHFTKAGSRILINTSPEPFTNWTASIAEDLVVVGGLWASLQYPWLFVLGLVLFILIVAWLLPKIWRALKRIFRAIGEFFRGKPAADQGSDTTSGSKREELLHSLYHDASGSPKS